MTMLDSAGAVAILAGLVFGEYARRHPEGTRLSEESRRFLEGFWSYVEFLANAVLFILIGLEIRLSAVWQERRWVARAVVAVLAARALIVYLLTLTMRRLSLLSHVIEQA
jgi:CPA1 family monovalent cation:H+ antiporter